MYELLRNLDRRWVFLLMLLAVSLPILFQAQFPEEPSGLAQAVYDEVERLPEGSRVLLAGPESPASPSRRRGPAGPPSAFPPA